MMLFVLLTRPFVLHGTVLVKRSGFNKNRSSWCQPMLKCWHWNTPITWQMQALEMCFEKKMGLCFSTLAWRSWWTRHPLFPKTICEVNHSMPQHVSTQHQFILHELGNSALTENINPPVIRNCQLIKERIQEKLPTLCIKTSKQLQSSSVLLVEVETLT